MSKKLARLIGSRRPLDEGQTFSGDDADDENFGIEALLDSTTHPSLKAIYLANPELPHPLRMPDRRRLVVIRSNENWERSARWAARSYLNGIAHEVQGPTLNLERCEIDVREILASLSRSDVLLQLAVDDVLPDVLARIASAEIDATRVREEHMTEVLRRHFGTPTTWWPAGLDPLSFDCVHIDLAIEQASDVADFLEILSVFRAEAGTPEPEPVIAEADDDSWKRLPTPAGPTARVLTSPIAATKTTATKALWTACEKIVNVDIPLRTVYNDPTEALVAEWPHASDVIRRLLAGVRVGDVIKLRPTLIVGAPGTGKTALLQAIAQCLDTPYFVFPCASSGDNSFGGTPARWHSSQLSTPGEAIRQHGVANPIVILDELEKAGRHYDNGSLVDALLPMLEAHTASGYFEAALDAPIDLSHVSFVATANTLSIPAPLKDRFDVVQMPDPGPQHIGPLTRRIVADIQRKKGLVDGMIPPVAPDEEDLLKKAWKGGSLRKLARIVEALVDNRDRLEIRN
ncbi:AAA family ATPase [Aurantimonas coralicida]|uniref:AAA family ATPase n=1 Tax=Aurantimonas coralicida TaxID=182270 RepID=UPI00239835AA|nr:AAA family ATPase [Aurantimonas coralicida]MDE0925221.1 AAA family ATPase [Aurantimonas coralicida]